MGSISIDHNKVIWGTNFSVAKGNSMIKDFILNYIPQQNEMTIES